MPMNLSKRAHLLMIRYASKSDDPVTEVDRRTSMADARIGLCLAKGVPSERICPARGYDYSDAAYERVRGSWLAYARMHGFSRFYDQAAYDEALRLWREHRPDLMVDGWIPEELMRDD